MRIVSLNTLWQLAATGVVLILLSVGAVTLVDRPPSGPDYTDDPLSFVRFYYSGCIDAHRQIGESHWELVEQGFNDLSEYGIQYQVMMNKLPTAPQITLEIQVDSIFPDAPLLACLIDEEQQNVLSVVLDSTGWIDIRDPIAARIPGRPPVVPEWQQLRYSLARVVEEPGSDEFGKLVLPESPTRAR